VSTTIASTAALIDEVLQRHYRIDLAKVSATAYAPLRAQVLSSLADELHAIWYLHDWTFRYVDTTVTLKKLNLPDDDGYHAALPADWANEGRDGGVWLTDPDRGQIQWKRSGEITDLQRTYPDIVGVPEWYAVEGVRNLTVYPKTTGADRSLYVRYQQTVPNLVDETTDAGGLDVVPIDWIRGALYLGTVVREMVRKGQNELVAAQAQLYQNAVYSLVCSERQGKPWQDYLPRFPGSSDVYYDWF
jgi:hypothetical protein